MKTMVWSHIDYDYQSVPWQRESVSLVPYACVSREWQLAFERFTFRTVVVRSSQVSRFNEYVTAHRMAFLRTVCFRIIIPELSINDGVEWRRQDNTAFTKAIKDLWALLKSIEHGCTNQQALKLRLHLSAQPRSGYIIDESKSMLARKAKTLKDIAGLLSSLYDIFKDT